jgi:protein TonB
VFTGDDVAVYNRVFSQGTPLNEMSKDAESAVVKTQTTSAKPIGEEAFIKVESMPTFRGGDLNGYRNWVQSQLQYPKEAKDKGVQGRVIFSFVVEKDGSVSEFKVLNTPDKIFSAEVERVFKLTPKWEPGKQNGKAVRVKYTVPITFTL